MALAQWGAAALGAFISGIIGIAAVEYRNLRDGFEEQRRWYDKTIRLAERAEQGIVEEGSEESEGNEEPRGSPDAYGELEHVSRTHRYISGKLHEHIANAPPTVSSNLLEQAEEVARSSEFAAENEVHTSGGMTTYSGTYFDNAASEAKQLKRLAQEERDTVGILWL